MEEEEMLTLRAEREKYIQEAKVLTQIFKFSQILRKLKLSAFLLNKKIKLRRVYAQYGDQQQTSASAS